METARYGLGLRRPHFDDYVPKLHDVDFLEIVPENFMEFGGKALHTLHALREYYPLVMHGVSLNLGGVDPLREDYLDSLSRLASIISPPWFSDHLSSSSAFGVEYHDLLPVPFTMEAVHHVVDRITYVQARMRTPFLLENPSYYIVLPGAEMTEAEFIGEVLSRADCGLLLDVNNVFVNSRNHGYAAKAFIDALPLQRVRQIHLAGHDDSGNFLIDTHGASTPSSVLDLYAYVIEKVGPTWTMIERDNQIPPLDELRNELHIVREIGDASLLSWRRAA